MPVGVKSAIEPKPLPKKLTSNVTVEEMANLLNISVPGLYKRRQVNELLTPDIKEGRRVLYSPELTRKIHAYYKGQ